MRLLLVLFCLLVVAGCGGSSSTPTSGLAAEIPGTSWTLERVVLPESGEVLRGDGDQVTFTAEGDLSVSSCNACSGEYRVRNDVLEVEALACTRKACLPGTVELERYLSGALTLRRDGSYLILDVVTETGAEGPQILLVPASTR